MKAFDLERAKAGEPICLEDGRPARIVCFDRQHDKRPLVVLIKNDYGEEDPSYFGLDGVKVGLRLKMAPTKHKGWIAIYRTDCGITDSTNIYEHQDELISRLGMNAIYKIIEVEWEE